MKTTNDIINIMTKYEYQVDEREYKYDDDHEYKYEDNQRMYKCHDKV